MKQTIRTAALFAFSILVCTGAFPAEPERGKVIPDVKCEKDDRFSYSLYLPSNYSEERSWPVIFCFAPDAKGDVPVRLLQKPAEEFGFILAGSNSSKNGPWEPIVKAQESLWSEINSRFKVDTRRSYAMGFSGGARAGLYIASSKKGRFAGMISCGAFSSEHGDVSKGAGMAFILITGESDFNYFEMKSTSRKLEKLGLRTWLECYDGGHAWPPETILAEAVYLLHADAMMAGLAPSDAGLLTRLIEKYSARAASLASGGKKKKAMELYANIASFFKPCAESAASAAEAQRLGGDPAVIAEVEVEKRCQGYAERLTLAKDAKSYSVIVKELGEIRSRGGMEAFHAEKVLRMASFQLGQKGAEELRLGELSSAKRDLEAAVAIFPNDPALNYNAACANSRLGRKADAIAFLDKAIKCGFSQYGLLKSDSDLDKLRKEPEFIELLKRIDEKSGAPREAAPAGGK